MIKQANKCLLAVFAFLTTVGFLFAQNEGGGPVSGWRLTRGEGSITFIRSGVRSLYRGNTEEFRNIIFRPGDMIQTGKGNAEIQYGFGPSETNTTVILRESTTLVIGQPENGIIALDLYYGRIRSTSGTINNSLIIRANASSALLRGFDVAIDYIIRPGNPKPFMAIHYFKGQGELTPRSSPDFESVKVSLRENESIFLEYHIPFIYVERRAMNTQVLAYWGMGSAIAAVPTEPPLEMEKLPPDVPQQEVSVQEVSTEPIVMESRQIGPVKEIPPAPNRGLPKVKRSLIFNGLLLMAAGGGMMAYSQLGNSPAKREIFYSSLAPMGMGTILFASGLIFRPSKVPYAQ